jgi:hypothetical protein
VLIIFILLTKKMRKVKCNVTFASLSLKAKGHVLPQVNDINGSFIYLKLHFLEEQDIYY